MNRKELKEEKEKLRTLSLKGKCWYLWAYYKIPILLTLSVIFLFQQAIGAFLRSRQDCMLYCAFINQSYAGEANLEDLKKDFMSVKNFQSIRF